MGRGVLNVVIGAAAIVGGLAGELVLIGTNSSLAFAAVGVAIASLGVYQILRARR